MDDTPRHVLDLQRELLRQHPPGARVAMASAMFDAARALMLASFPAGQSHAERTYALLLRTYGDELSEATRRAVAARAGASQTASHATE